MGVGVVLADLRYAGRERLSEPLDDFLFFGSKRLFVSVGPEVSDHDEGEVVDEVIVVVEGVCLFLDGIEVEGVRGAGREPAVRVGFVYEERLDHVLAEKLVFDEVVEESGQLNLLRADGFHQLARDLLRLEPRDLLPHVSDRSELLLRGCLTRPVRNFRFDSGPQIHQIFVLEKSVDQDGRCDGVDHSVGEVAVLFVEVPHRSREPDRTRLSILIVDQHDGQVANILVVELDHVDVVDESLEGFGQ